MRTENTNYFQPIINKNFKRTWPIFTGKEAKDLTTLSLPQLQEAFHVHGALEFLGFNLTTEQFIEFSNNFGGKFIPYVVGAYSRESVGSDQTVVKVNSGELAISLHGEQHYKKNKADLIWFYCDKPSLKGGSTIIGDGVEIFRRLSDSAKKILIENKIKYVRWLKGGFWQKVFQTDNLIKLGLICEHDGLTYKIHQDQSITTEYITSALVDTEFGKGPAFVNNILVILSDQENFPQEAMELTCSEVTFENGQKIPTELVNEIIQVCGQVTFPIKWQSGDFVLLNNKRFMHGRESFEGQKERKIITRMAKYL